MRNIILIIAIILYSSTVSATDAVLSENAPKDKPTYSKNEEQLNKLHKAIEPYVNEAKKSYPQAKQRFLAGLPSGENLFITTRLHDSENREEQVFVLVHKIENGNVYGIIYTNIENVHGFKYRQKYKFLEADLLDWLISKPDGSEEGNVVGKFLDTYQP